MSARRGSSQTTLPSHPKNRGSGFSGGGDRGGSPRGGQDSAGGGGPQGRRANPPTVFSHSPGDIAQLDVKVKALEDEIEKQVLKPSHLDPSLPIRPGFGTEGRRILLYANYMHLDWGDVVLYRYALKSPEETATKKTISTRNKERLVVQLLEENFTQNRSGIVTDFNSLIISNTNLNLSQNVYGRFRERRPATGRILVNVQVKHSPFYNSGPIVKLIHTFASVRGFDKTKLEEFLKKLTIYSTHIARHRVISGLAKKEDGKTLPHPPRVLCHGAGASQIHFWLEDQKKYVTVARFFQQKYNITLQNLDLPVLNVGNEQDPVYLPAEVCEVPLGQAFTRKLSVEQTRNIARVAIRRPVHNAHSIVEEGVSLLNIGQSANPTHNAFNFSLNPRLITAPGRVLVSPSVNYGNKKNLITRFGSWNMQNIHFVSKANVDKWSWLFIKTQDYKGTLRQQQDLKLSLKEFVLALGKVGITCPDYAAGEEITVNFETETQVSTVNEEVDKAIRKISSTFSSSSSKKTFLLVILASDKPAIYNRVKLNCDVREGISSVCVLASNFAKKNSHTFANIALKVNLKLGGINQTLDSSTLGFVSEGKTMFVGLDVTHPSPESLKVAPSVVGMVSSINQLLGQWRASVVIQEARKEMVAGLRDLVKKHLGLWRQQNNGSLPDNIVVFRDGVSESQYSVVLDAEKPLIQKACAEVYPANATKHGLPRLNITIVSKRHRTRFYPTKSDEADGSENPFNGTVVDRGVTEARNWDFYLQAHAAIKGTARPIHYYVVYDEVFRQYQQRQATSPMGRRFANAADVLEDLTHNMCYLFGRCTRSVSLCPPAYYADIVCDRAGRHLSEVFEPPTAANTSPAKTRKPIVPSQSMVSIHPRVADTMYFI